MSAGQRSQREASAAHTPESPYPAGWGAQPRRIEAGLQGDASLTELRHTGQSDEHHRDESSDTAALTPLSETNIIQHRVTISFTGPVCVCAHTREFNMALSVLTSKKMKRMEEDNNSAVKSCIKIIYTNKKNGEDVHIYCTLHIRAEAAIQRTTLSQ